MQQNLVPSPGLYGSDLSHPGTERGVSDVARPVAGAVLVALLLLRTAAIFLGDGASYAILRGFTSASHPWLTAILSSNLHIVVIADLATLLILGLLLSREGSGLRQLLGRIRPGRDALVGAGTGLALLLAFLIASFVGNLAAYGGPPPPQTATATPPLWFGIWSITVMPVTVAFAEELLYRGYLLPRIRARIGLLPAIVVVSLAFGIQHAGLSASSGQAVLARVITTFLLGIVLAVAMTKLKRLWPLIIGHWLIDVVGLGVPVLTAAVSST